MTSSNKGCSDAWMRYVFKTLWGKNNRVYATAYELRHHYAVENINRWTGHGMCIHQKLLSLSKSMGHRDVESTKYYYSLVPGFSEIVENTAGDIFNEIIPDLINDEKIYR